MNLDKITFYIPKKMQEIIKYHPFFNGLVVNTKKLPDTSTGLASFQLNNPSIGAAKIVGMALSDKAIPYEMVVSDGQKIVENMRVQFQDGMERDYEAVKIDEVTGEDIYLKDPDDVVLVDNINSIEMTDEQKKMVGVATECRLQREAKEKAEYDAFRAELQAKKKENKPTTAAPKP